LLKNEKFYDSSLRRGLSLSEFSLTFPDLAAPYSVSLPLQGLHVASLSDLPALARLGACAGSFRPHRSAAVRGAGGDPGAQGQAADTRVPCRMKGGL